MKDMFIVAKFTMKEMLKRKSFIISTLILAAFIVIGCNIPNILDAFSSDDNGDVKTKILLVDRNSIFEDYLNDINTPDSTYEFVAENKSDEDVAAEINGDKYKYAIVFTENGENNIVANFVVKSYNQTFDFLPEDAVQNLNELYRNIQLKNLNLSEAELSKVNLKFNVDVKTVGEEVQGNILSYFAICMILFFAIFTCANQVSTAITTEKTSKIVETLATSTSTTNIIVGKTFGIGLVGLCQLIFLGTVGVVSIKCFLPGDVLSMFINLDNVTPILAILVLLYFVFGYFLYSFLFALTGSTVAKPEDVQSANTPITFILLIGFYLAYFTLMSPTASIAKLAAFVPISSPFCMICRVLMGLSSVSEVLASLGILALTTILIAWISIKVYANAILNTGTRMSIGEALKLARNKKN